MTVGISGISGIFSEGFGQEQKIGSHGQRIAERNAASDMKQRLIRAVDGRCQADGFEFRLFSHWPPPRMEMWWGRVLRNGELR
ncbi:hypothetical protein D3C73_1187400 [compost metagenome]